MHDKINFHEIPGNSQMGLPGGLCQM